ncbi:MAG: tetratricopeptide repeat protein [Isosphaeraceae bacterium]
MVCYVENGVQVITDRDTFDYRYGDAVGPDPAQRDLDALLPSVTRVCVLEGAMFQGRSMGGRVLIDVRDAGALRDLADCLQIVEDPGTFGHCACLGGPTMELYAGHRLAATIGVQHGRAIRWKRWHHDAQLQNVGRLTRWLHDQGIPPAQLEAIYGRGMAAGFIGDGDDDLAEHEKRARDLCARARELANAGDLERAERLCAQAHELNADEVDSYALRGEILFHLGRVSEAGASCSTAIDRGCRHAAIYHIRAIAADSEGRTEEALADCETALHLDPDHAGAHNSRGFIHARLGQFDEASEDFTEAIRLAPEWVLPHLHRAEIHRQRARLDAALSDYNRAIELAEAASASHDDGDPMLAIMYCRRGDVRHDQFEEEEAEADFAEAYQRHPETAAGFLGEMWMHRGAFVKALEAFAQLVRLRPDESRGYHGRGVAEEALGDLEAAERDYSMAIDLHPDEGISRLPRARVRHRLARPAEALADVSAHLRSHPEDATALLIRSGLHRENHEFAAALDDLNSAERVAPQDPQVCNNLAWMLSTCPDESLRDGVRAVALARQACEATHWEHPFCLGTLAAALAETGAYPEAVHWQAKALGLYPESERDAGQARLELYQDGRPYRE